jgi:hypothetical protein
MNLVPHREGPFCQGKLIRCKSFHVDYACSCGGVDMSDVDGMSFKTEVLAAGARGCL